MSEKVSGAAWPIKTGELFNQYMDSTVWNDFPFRDDDIVIATYGKSGTTWMQQIVSQLLFAGAADLEVAAMSQWLDSRIKQSEKLAVLEGQKHRRFVKTHLPVNALVYSPRAKYIYVGRDGRDVAWSLYNHLRNANEQNYYKFLNETPERIGPPLERPSGSVRDFFIEWLALDGYPAWSWWENVRSWWTIRDLPNLLLVHFADLKADLPGEVRRIADFLEIYIDDGNWPAILKHSSFEYMRENGQKTVPRGGIQWDGGIKTFINQGTNGRWRETLSRDESRRYDELAREKLDEDCAKWLAKGARAA